jgi:hypothetical protein
MPNSKARNLANLLSGTGATEFQGESGIVLPDGTTAQRPSPATLGTARYNTTLGKNEVYDADGWTVIASSPEVTSVSPTTINESDTTQTIVITGDKFDIGATAVMFDSAGSELTPTTSTRNSSTQITITYSGGDVVTSSNEPYDVKVINSTGLSSILADAVSLNESPDWSTASGNLATVYEDVAMANVSLNATDPEGGAVSYAITSGALPTGVSLNSSGVISGTPNAGTSGYSSSGVTHNFSVTASDGTNSSVRSFNIIRKWYDGSSSSLAVTSGSALVELGVSSGNYWIKPNSSQPAYLMYVDNTTNGGGWVRVAGIARNNGVGYVTNSAYQMDNNHPPGSDSYSRHPGSAWMEALRDASTYSGNSPYWMHAYSGDFTDQKWIHSDMDNDIDLVTAVTSGGDPRGKFSWSYQGTFYNDAGNDGSRGMGGSHYNTIGGKAQWAWCRHPEQGDGGFNGDGKGRASGYLYIK